MSMNLTITSGQSEIKPVSMPADFAALPNKLSELGLQDGYMIVWQIQRISWGKLTAGKISLATDTPKNSLILELRIFNEDAELHLQKQGDQFVGRYRNDQAGDKAEYVDSASRFWGQYSKDQATADDGFMTLVDADRKLSMKLPAIDQPAKHYALETRSYIGINEQTAQAGYTDYRFKAILPADMKGDEE